MRRQLAQAGLAATLMFACSAATADPPQTSKLESSKSALSKLQDYVGQWRGVGQPKRGSTRGAGGRLRERRSCERAQERVPQQRQAVVAPEHARPEEERGHPEGAALEGLTRRLGESPGHAVRADLGDCCVRLRLVSVNFLH